MHAEYWLTDFNYSSHLCYFFNFMKYHNSHLQLYSFHLSVYQNSRNFGFETKENRSRDLYARSNGCSKRQPWQRILKGKREESLSRRTCTRAQMRNEQSTCPHLASSTWMELIAGLNVGIVRKKVKGKATCWQKLSPVCKREGGVKAKRGEAALTLAMTSFSYTLARVLASTFPRKNGWNGNCTRKITRTTVGQWTN